MQRSLQILALSALCIFQSLSAGFLFSADTRANQEFGLVFENWRIEGPGDHDAWYLKGGGDVVSGEEFPLPESRQITLQCFGSAEHIILFLPAIGIEGLRPTREPIPVVLSSGNGVAETVFAKDLLAVVAVISALEGDEAAKAMGIILQSEGSFSVKVGDQTLRVDTTALPEAWAELKTKCPDIDAWE